MMKARMQCHKPNEVREPKNEKPQSCAILVSVKMTDKHRTCLALVDIGSSATLANEEIVQDCKDKEVRNEVE